MNIEEMVFTMKSLGQAAHANMQLIPHPVTSRPLYESSIEGNIVLKVWLH